MATSFLPAIAISGCFASAAVFAASCDGDRERAFVHGTGGGGASVFLEGTAGAGGAPAPKAAHLVVPKVVDFPYVLAGKGAITAAVDVANDGDAPLAGLDWELSGDPTIAIGAAPSTLAPGEHAEVLLTWAGSPVESITQASLAVASPTGHAIIPVFAVAGDPGLGPATWEDVQGAGGVLAGTGATVAMPAAPFPDGVSPYTDPSVRVFLPEGYRDRGAQDLVLHFHGWSTTLADTLSTHLYQQHLYASGSDAVLVVPQGPVSAQSSDFGKLMTKGGVSRLLTEVLILLYREGKITQPVRGDFIVTSHSGGYQAVGATLDPNNLAPRVSQIDLFDSLYSYEVAFEGFAFGGGVLRSNYSENGGTVEGNQNVATFLAQHAIPFATAVTQRALADAAPILDFTTATHDGTTRLLGAYGEELRWKLRHSRRGPRVELREVTASGGTARARWLAPADEDVTGYVVETSADGSVWNAAATAPPSAGQASFPLPRSGVRVRVTATTTGVDPEKTQRSDTYRVDPAAKVLVVDGFDRVLDGAFGGLAHDFAARIGEAAGPVATISHRAVTEDGFDLTAWPAVVWLLGDESTADVSLSDAEQIALLDYVDGGGHLVMSGSNLGYDIGQSPPGAMFLAHCFGAMFVADDAGSLEVGGHGPLAGVASFAIGGPGAPYAALSPDALAPTHGGEVVLEYGSGTAAGVGLPHKGALVGFPLELSDKAALAPMVRALLSYVGASP